MPDPALARILSLALVLPLFACTPSRGDDDDGDDDDTATSECWGADTLLDVASAPGPGSQYASPWVTGTCEGDTFTVESNGLPHYTFVPMTPNALTEVAQHWELTTSPELTGTQTTIPLLGQIAFTIGGVAIFGPNEAAQPDPFGDPIWNGITDGCTGHTAMEYHNHALSQKCLSEDGLVAEPWTLDDVDSSVPSPVLGWALDGFPIYGNYGCLDEDCDEVVSFMSGWEMIGDPTTYAWDAHEYVAATNPRILDQCNGRVQPDGSYGYHTTPTFPYILGCYSGTAQASGGGPPR